MTKQGEIREGITIRLYEFYEFTRRGGIYVTLAEEDKRTYGAVADQFLSYLDQQGVRLVVEKEPPSEAMIPFSLDPSIPMASRAGVSIQKSVYAAYEAAQADMLSAGWRYTEGLVGGVKSNSKREQL